MADNKVIRRSIYWGMSEEAIRERVVENALSLLGIKEGTKDFEEKIRSVYNAQKPLPRGHKLSKSDPWCAAYITVVGIMAEIIGVILPECSCSRMIELYKARGQWMERDDYDGQIGDILMWDWQDKGVGDCTGAPDHVGILVEKDGDNWKVAEGNCDNRVKLRPVRRDQIHIRGWCLPDYAALVHGFSDVPADAWYREAVEWADGRGIAEGVGGMRFAPEAVCNRAHAVTMLWRLCGSPAAENGCPFGDVPRGAWFAEAVAWAAEKGVTAGIAEEVFAPDAPCTRGQIATMLWRAAGTPQAECAAHDFIDVPGGSWFADAVEWCWCEGIAVGCSGTEFMPGKACTRAELVTMLWRMSQAR